MSTLITEPRVQEASINDPETRAAIATILSEQRAGVLCTCFMDIPHCSQMAFAAGDEQRSLFIVTPRPTTKYGNMKSNPNVSFLISTARNDPADPVTAKALTITALAKELDGERRHRVVALFSQRHPALAAFAAATTSVVMELKVSGYSLIDNFQQVTLIGVGESLEPG